MALCAPLLSRRGVLAFLGTQQVFCLFEPRTGMDIILWPRPHVLGCRSSAYLVCTCFLPTSTFLLSWVNQ